MAKVRHTSTVGTQIDTLEEWMQEDVHALDEDGEIIVSNPPSGYYKCYGVYMTKVGSKFFPVFVHDDTPEE